MTSLPQLSKDLAALVDRASAHVVRIDAGRGGSATATVWSADGLIVAAHHSVDDDEELTVALASGEVVKAMVVGRDPTTDLVLLRAEATGLAAPAWPDGDGPAAGELVLLLSRPGRAVRADLGIVSRAAGEWRAPSGGRLERYLETSLALRPGLSGGLLLAADGAPVGLATAGLLRGLAMAVPVTALRRVLAGLRAGGPVRRGYLGLATIPVGLPGPAAERAGQGRALLVTGVEPGGPAALAGILLGDALLSAGGQPLAGPHDLASSLEPERVGQATPLRILRAGEPLDVTVTIGPRPDAGRRERRCGR
jgi:S1-C subfamily serine protease